MAVVCARVLARWEQRCWLPVNRGCASLLAIANPRGIGPPNARTGVWSGTVCPIRHMRLGPRSLFSGAALDGLLHLYPSTSRPTVPVASLTAASARRHDLVAGLVVNAFLDVTRQTAAAMAPRPRRRFGALGRGKKGPKRSPGVWTAPGMHLFAGNQGHHWGRRTPSNRRCQHASATRDVAKTRRARPIASGGVLGRAEIMDSMRASSRRFVPRQSGRLTVNFGV